MLLKKSLTRHVANYGFDTFLGFPDIISPQDEWENFQHLFDTGSINLLKLPISPPPEIFQIIL